MTKVISVYSPRKGEGKTTIATTLAKVLGQHKKSVLFVELDALQPTFATITGISDDMKNTLHYMMNLSDSGKLNPTEYILKDAQEKMFPDQVHFMTFPKSYDIQQFPKLISSSDNKVLGKIAIDQFSYDFVNHFRRLEYDMIIFMLPNQLNDLFALPVMIESDYIVNVVTTNRVAMKENLQMLDMLKGVSELNVSEKWMIFLNKAVNGIPKGYIQEVFPGQQVLGRVFFDQEKILNDLTGNISSVKIEQNISMLLSKLDLGIEVQAKKRLFGVMG